MVAAIGLLGYVWISARGLAAVRAPTRLGNSPTAGGDYRFTCGPWRLSRSRRLCSPCCGSGPGARTAGSTCVSSCSSRSSRAPSRYWGVRQLERRSSAASLPARHGNGDSAGPPYSRFSRWRTAGRARPGCWRRCCSCAWRARQDHSLPAFRPDADPTGPDVAQIFEYQTPTGSDEHFHGRRVMATGSCSLWLNAFVDSPQLSGGHDPFALNRMQLIAVYIHLQRGRRQPGRRIPRRCGSRLSACMPSTSRVRTAGSSTRRSANPRMFEGLLPVFVARGDDTIYQVPRKRIPLAHVIPASAVVQRAPLHGLGREPDPAVL